MENRLIDTTWTEKYKIGFLHALLLSSIVYEYVRLGKKPIPFSEIAHIYPSSKYENQLNRLQVLKKENLIIVTRKNPAVNLDKRAQLVPNIGVLKDFIREVEINIMLS